MVKACLVIALRCRYALVSPRHMYTGNMDSPCSDMHRVATRFHRSAAHLYLRTRISEKWEMPSAGVQPKKDAIIFGTCFLNFSTASRTGPRFQRVKSGPNKKCQENKKSLHPEMFWRWVQSPHANAKMVQAVQTGMASTHFLLQMLCLLA